MCGIAGLIQFNSAPVDADKMNAILHGLSHRGFDHSKVVFGATPPRKDACLSSKANIAFGHRRLSVIDLSDSASQPMSCDDGEIWVVFNGEIYNYIELRADLTAIGHKFKSNSDTEVILAAYKQWGEDCVMHLNGMFAFALWDERRARLICARDHLGVKPFYYIRTQEFLVFASESKALQQFHGNRLDRHGVAAYLLGSYVPADLSIFEGVQKLLPAHLLVVEPSGQIAQRRYWQISGAGTEVDKPSSRISLERMLISAVTRQLRSDVPVGALLSGGVDSGIVVAIAARQKANLYTYSVAFDGHPVNELEAANIVAENYGTCHRQRLVGDREAMCYLNVALSNLTEPIADPAIIPSYILSEMAVSDGVKVLLSGTGGDEAFGGYERYVGGGTWKRSLLSRVPQVFRRIVGRLLPLPSKLGARLCNPSLDMLFTTAGSYELCSQLFNDKKQMGSFLERLAASIPTSINNPRYLLYEQMGFDLSVYLPDEILLLFDQMTMANTIEGRVPLLDVGLIEAAIRFPAACHVNNGRTKVLFREVASSYLGCEHVWRKKHGFSGPVPFWVNRNRKLFEDAARGICEIPGLEDFNVTPFLREGSKVLDSNASFELFSLYCLRHWYKSLSSKP